MRKYADVLISGSVTLQSMNDAVTHVEMNDADLNEDPSNNSAVFAPLGLLREQGASRGEGATSLLSS